MPVEDISRLSAPNNAVSVILLIYGELLPIVILRLYHTKHSLSQIVK